jgi:hypothetical protein
MDARPRVERFRRRLIRRGANSERTVASTPPALQALSRDLNFGSIDQSNYLAPRLLFGGAFGPWCNGSTGDFGSLSPCSNQGGLILIRSTSFRTDWSVHRDSSLLNFTKCFAEFSFDDCCHLGRRQGNSHEQRSPQSHAHCIRQAAC